MCQKAQNFTLISNPLKKFWMHQKQVINKNVTFYAFTHVRQTCFVYNFFWVNFLTTFSTDSKSAWNSTFFDTFFLIFFKTIFSRSYLYFCQTLKPNAQKKAKKMYLVNVSQISILHPSKGLYSSFSKKSQIRCTLLHNEKKVKKFHVFWIAEFSLRARSFSCRLKKILQFSDKKCYLF
jgi:hypothetical protein